MTTSKIEKSMEFQYIGNSSFGYELANSVRHHGLLLILATLVCGAGLGLATFSGREIVPMSGATFIWKYLIIAGAWAFAGSFLYKLGRMITIEHPERPLVSLRQWIVTSILHPARLINGTLCIFAFFLLMSGFSLAKHAIPGFAGFNWDTAIVNWGPAVQFGYFDFQLLWPVMGYDWVTVAIDFVYVSWFSVMFTTFFVTAFQPELSMYRHRVALSIILAWSISGMVLATLFASAGPVYFSNVTGAPNPYQPMLDYLQEVDVRYGLFARAIHAELWQAFTAPSSVSMITAFPSVHVTFASLLACACFRMNFWLRYLSIAYAVAIFAGSIWLGWHYSVDGYVGALVALASWKAARNLTGWYHGSGAFEYARGDWKHQP
jgi:hypothetical protein